MVYLGWADPTWKVPAMVADDFAIDRTAAGTQF